MCFQAWSQNFNIFLNFGENCLNITSDMLKHCDDKLPLPSSCPSSVWQSSGGQGWKNDLQTDLSDRLFAAFPMLLTCCSRSSLTLLINLFHGRPRPRVPFSVGFVRKDLTGIMVCSTPRLLVAFVVFVNPLKGRGVSWLYFAIQIWPTFFNFWHSGTLALRAERQSARMSEIKNVD